jgi:hypothetical protein
MCTICSLECVSYTALISCYKYSVIDYVRLLSVIVHYPNIGNKLKVF